MFFEVGGGGTYIKSVEFAHYNDSLNIKQAINEKLQQLIIHLTIHGHDVIFYYHITDNSTIISPIIQRSALQQEKRHKGLLFV